MADGLSTAVANAALSNIIGTDMNDIALHTGAPGSAGTANPSSTTTREAVTWGSPASGSVSASNSPAWPSWAGTNGEVVSDISFWSASTSGTFGGSAQLSATVTMNTGDTLTLTSVSISIPTAS
jgi:hypothetical protein